jgi:pyrroloquinoline quinone biosynthesis protein B
VSRTKFNLQSSTGTKGNNKLNKIIQKLVFIFIVFILATNIFTKNVLAKNITKTASQNSVSLHILGVAQDAGYPQISCYKPHCMPGWEGKLKRRTATSIAVVDHENKKKFVFEATPHLPEQLYNLNQVAPDSTYSLSGIFLTHAHIGHYTGLMYFGREAAGSKNVPVYVMPKMKQYLTTNGPWSQLVKLNNIALQDIANNITENITSLVSVTPMKVPHRDEFSETVGYKIKGPNKTLLFIPDIDKWHKWKVDIREQVKSVDYAFLDATFFDSKELPNRNMSEVPHPFVIESMTFFKDLSDADKSKVHFIHFNHSNPLLNIRSEQTKAVLKAGFNVANESLIISL